MSRTTPALMAVAAATAALAAMPAAPAPAARRSCARPGAHVLARSATARIFWVEHGESSEYGTAVTLYGCLAARGRAVRLGSFADTDAVAVRHVRLRGPFVAYALTVVDVPCSKYTSDPCDRAAVEVYDLRSGRARVRARARADAVALTASGWVAWVTPAPRAVDARDSAGRRRLDTGAIDPRSLAATGRHGVAWTRDGARRSAVLR